MAMDNQTLIRREKMLKLSEELLSVEKDRLNGAKYHTVDETVQMMEEAVRSCTMAISV
jgi:hypothetical protein